MYKNMKILIIGAARSGISVAKLLAEYNNDITLTDTKELNTDDKALMDSLGIKVVITNDQLGLIDKSYDLIVKNPAIMYVSDIVKKISELGIRLENEMEVAYHFIPKNVKIIGITGSNGKTTTTTITYELLKRHGINVVLGGNIGYPLSQVVGDIKEGDTLLLEISDHQLLDFNDFKTDISVLTNIIPTHLDYHGTYEHYMWTKKNIFNHQTLSDLAIINKSSKDALKISEEINSKKIYFNDDKNFYNETGIYIDNELIIKLEDILLQGSHNYEDIMAALLVLKEFGINKDIVKEFLSQFGGVAHRLEFVKELNGIKFYNDSKSTNPIATITALKTFKEPVHLILGGLERNQDFNELNDYMKNVKCIYSIGTVTERVKEYGDSIDKPCIACYTLEKAIEEIKENMQTGDIVLLSPASSSQDFYVKFEDRGEEFKNLIAKL